LIERYADKWPIYVLERNKSKHLEILIKNIDKKTIIEIMKVLPKSSSSIEL